MKQRYILCILLAGLMLYYAVPRLSVHAAGMEGIFAISWLALAAIVLLGNLSALMYAPKKAKNTSKFQSYKKPKRRARSFG